MSSSTISWTEYDAALLSAAVDSLGVKKWNALADGCHDRQGSKSYTSTTPRSPTGVAQTYIYEEENLLLDKRGGKKRLRTD
jgi:hypothetical protein